MTPEMQIRKHILIGAGAGLALFLVYLGILALAQGYDHAVQQAGSMWGWIMALAAGFGIQAGLFSFIRAGLRRRAAAASVAASGGVSAGAMAACCAHHLTDLLPFLGLAGLSAILVRYQTALMIVALLFNVVGIVTMLEIIQRFQLCPRVSGWKWDLGRIKVRAMVLAGLIAVVALLVTLRD